METCYCIFKKNVKIRRISCTFFMERKQETRTKNQKNHTELLPGNVRYGMRMWGRGVLPIKPDWRNPGSLCDSEVHVHRWALKEQHQSCKHRFSLSAAELNNICRSSYRVVRHAYSWVMFLEPWQKSSLKLLNTYRRTYSGSRYPAVPFTTVVTWVASSRVICFESPKSQTFAFMSLSNNMLLHFTSRCMILGSLPLCR